MFIKKVKNKPAIDDEQTIWTHFAELRRRVIYIILVLNIFVILGYEYADDIFQILTLPLRQAVKDPSQTFFIFTNLTEPFMTYMKLSFYVGFFCTLPFILLQIWFFVAPGLYRHERHNAWGFLVASPVLFIAGACLAYFFVLPLAWSFFLSFGSSTGPFAIHVQPKVSEYFSLVIGFLLAFGLAFQLPVVLTLLAKFGIVTSGFLTRFRKLAIILAFVIGAILTPPDVLSQTSLALPLILLYEGSILVIRRIEKQRHEDIYARSKMDSREP